jgi:hypothetical protein
MREYMNLFELHALIRKSALNEENRSQYPKDDSVVWDFVLAEVLCSEEFKQSDFSSEDVEMAMDEVISRMSARGLLSR